MHLVLILDLRFYLISDRLCDVMTFLFRPNVIRPFSQRVCELKYLHVDPIHAKVPQFSVE